MKKVLIFLMVMAGAAQAMKGQAGDKSLVGKKRDQQEAQDRGAEYLEEGSQKRKRDQKRERKSNLEQEKQNAPDEVRKEQKGPDQTGLLFNTINQKGGMMFSQEGGVPQEVEHDMMENNTVRGAEPELGPGGRPLLDKARFSEEEKIENLQEAMAVKDTRKEAEEEQKRGEDQRQAQEVESIATSAHPSSAEQMSEQDQARKRNKKHPIGGRQNLVKEIFKFLPTNEAARVRLTQGLAHKGINKPMTYQEHLKFENTLDRAKLDETFHTIQRRAEGMNPVVSLDLSAARLNGRPIVVHDLLPYAENLPQRLRSIHIGDTLTVARPVGPYIPLLSRMTGLQTLRFVVTILNQDYPQEMRALEPVLAQMPNLTRLNFSFENTLNPAKLDEIFQTIQELGRVNAQGAMNPGVSLDLSAARLNGRPILLNDLLPYAENLPQTLRSIDIGDTLLIHRPVGPYIPLLSRMTDLLNLSIAYQDNVQGIQVLAPALRQMINLTELTLSYNKISIEEIQVLAPSLAQMSNLAELTLSDNQISVEGMRMLAPALAQMPNLRQLNLSDNQIGVEGMQALAPALPQIQHLTHLNLADNQIGDEGMQALAPALAKTQNLRELNLSDNRIGDAGMQALVPFLVQMDRLFRVILSSNRIGDTGARALAQAFSNKPPQTIPLFSLEFNNVSDQAAQDLIRVRAQRFRF